MPWPFDETTRKDYTVGDNDGDFSMVADQLKNEILTPLSNKSKQTHARSSSSTFPPLQQPLHFDAIPPKPRQSLYPKFEHQQPAAPEPVTPLRTFSQNAYDDPIGIMKTPGTAGRNKNVSFAPDGGGGFGQTAFGGLNGGAFEGFNANNAINYNSNLNGNDINNNIIDLSKAAPLYQATPKNAPLPPSSSEILGIRQKLNFGGDRTQDPRRPVGMQKKATPSYPLGRFYYGNVNGLGASHNHNNSAHTNNNFHDINNYKHNNGINIEAEDKNNEADKSMFDTTAGSTSRFMVSLLPAGFPGKLPSKRTVRAKERQDALERLKNEAQEPVLQPHQQTQIKPPENKAPTTSSLGTNPLTRYFGSYPGANPQKNKQMVNRDTQTSFVEQEEISPEKLAQMSEQSNKMALIEQLLMRNTCDLRTFVLSESAREGEKQEAKAESSGRIAELERDLEICAQYLQEMIVERDNAAEWGYQKDEEYNELKRKLARQMKINTRLMRRMADAGISMDERGEIQLNAQGAKDENLVLIQELDERDREIDDLKKQVEELKRDQRELFIERQEQEGQIERLRRQVQEDERNPKRNKEEADEGRGMVLHFQECVLILEQLSEVERLEVVKYINRSNKYLHDIERHIERQAVMENGVSRGPTGEGRGALERALMRATGRAKSRVERLVELIQTEKKKKRGSEAIGGVGLQGPDAVGREGEGVDIGDVVKEFKKISDELWDVYTQATGLKVS